jgi:hypothetical protein
LESTNMRWVPQHGVCCLGLHFSNSGYCMQCWISSLWMTTCITWVSFVPSFCSVMPWLHCWILSELFFIVIQQGDGQGHICWICSSWRWWSSNQGWPRLESKSSWRWKRRCNKG